MDEKSETRQLPDPQMKTLADGTREWRVGAFLHREDGPAVERADGGREWWWRGERHREGAPAVESPDGGRSWWRHGNPHREDGPASVDADGTRRWWLEGRMHREDGPAVEHQDGSVEWWFEGKAVSEAEHRRLGAKRRPRPAMKLWLLTPRPAVLRRAENPWRPWYDKVFAVVVRAESEARARELVQEHAGHEGLGIHQAFGMLEDEPVITVWIDEEYTRCVRLRPQGKEGVIVLDRREA
jgi:hypothetical protein